MDRPIFIVAAVPAELSGLRKRLAHPVVKEIAGKQVIQGRLAGQSVELLTAGPGQVNTAHALTARIEAQKPALVIQTGCAGVFDETGLSLGDIGIAHEEIDVQLGVEAPNAAISPLPFFILEKGSARIRNIYPMDSDLVERTLLVLKKVFATANTKVAAGPFVTVSSITASDGCARRYHKKYGALMENMEGVAAAHICILYDIPFLEIRSASNHVGRRDKKSWDLPLAFGQASLAVYTVIKEIASRKILI
jgi:futalosine hydrolase